MSMDPLVHLAAAGWPQAAGHSSRRPLGPGHARSFSSLQGVASDSSQNPRSYPSKYPSISHLRSSSIASSARQSFDDEMSTLPDPRHRALSPDVEAGTATPQHHPDLNDEVATLSTKLINAINHQTVLDDTLSSTRHELDTARDKIRDLEKQLATQRDIMSGDVWVRKSTLESEKKAMQAEKRAMQAKVAEETAKRIETEKERKKIEQELENLTTALFEEANGMVVRAKEDAKAEQDALQRKIDQLKSQLVDSEGLLTSQQEQLTELKHVMENMAEEEQTNGTAPSSPGLARFESKDDEPLTNGIVASPTIEVPSTPSHPTSFSHLLQPVLRTDLASYDDFISLARLSRKRAGSRVSSGSIGGLNGLSFGLGGSTSSAHPSNASTTSLANSVYNSNSAPQSPNTPASTVSAASTSGIPIPTLKETRFFKRVLTEDIEPTLRLDAAPGLSWLNRRSVTTSVSDGSLVVEPVPTNSPIFNIAKPHHSPCSLCGESRKDPLYLRNHRFRITEAENAQRFPLCKFCLTRVRSTCDFLGFLRMVKDGHWRAETEDSEKAAWEESVRLREQMFWSRIGGGVVPIGHSSSFSEAERSPRPSNDEIRPIKEETAEATEPEAVSPKDTEKADAEPETKTVIPEPHTPPEQTDGAPNARNSTQSLGAKSATDSQQPNRLSITIPSTE